MVAPSCRMPAAAARLFYSGVEAADVVRRLRRTIHRRRPPLPIVDPRNAPRFHV
jgi:hypothetical protein